MQENNVDPSQPAWSDQAARERSGRDESRHEVRARITIVRVMVAVLVFVLLAISIAGSFMAVRNSYASTNQPAIARATTDPTCLSTPTSSATSPAPTATRPKPTATKPPAPTATPTATATPTPTPTATATPTPTPTATATPTPTPTTSPVVNTSNNVQLLSYMDCTPTATATSTVTAQTPVASPTSVPAAVGANNASTPPGQSSGGGTMRLVMTVVGVLLVILLSLGIGWLAFRRMLLPKTATNLPPSGARPWSRTRVPNPASMGGIPALNMDQFNANAALAFSASNNRQMSPEYEQVSNGYMQQSNDYEQQGYEQASNGYVQQGFEPLNNGYMQPSYEQANNGYAQQGYEQINNGYMQQNNGYEQANNGYMQQGYGYATQSMNGYEDPQGNGFGTPAGGFAGFSDSFIPPSPQMFSQSEISMIPPGTGALPSLNNNHGFAPSSNAFNAMYGLPDDPFASSQPGGSPGWLDNLGNGNGFSEPQLPAMSDFVTGAPDLNDPYLADLIRQYSQKGEAVRPPQQTPQPEQQNGFQNSNWLQ